MRSNSNATLIRDDGFPGRRRNVSEPEQQPRDSIQNIITLHYKCLLNVILIQTCTYAALQTPILSVLAYDWKCRHLRFVIDRVKLRFHYTCGQLPRNTLYT